jgi:hypothetical protein
MRQGDQRQRADCHFMNIPHAGIAWLRIAPLPWDRNGNGVGIPAAIERDSFIRGEVRMLIVQDLEMGV